MGRLVGPVSSAKEEIERGVWILVSYTNTDTDTTDTFWSYREYAVKTPIMDREWSKVEFIWETIQTPHSRGSDGVWISGTLNGTVTPGKGVLMWTGTCSRAFGGPRRPSMPRRGGGRRDGCPAVWTPVYSNSSLPHWDFRYFGIPYIWRLQDGLKISETIQNPLTFHGPPAKHEWEKNGVWRLRWSLSNPSQRTWEFRKYDEIEEITTDIHPGVWGGELYQHLEDPDKFDARKWPLKDDRREGGVWVTSGWESRETRYADWDWREFGLPYWKGDRFEDDGNGILEILFDPHTFRKAGLDEGGR